MEDARRTGGDRGDRAHLERSRAVWDRWSGHYGMSEQDFEPYRRDLVERLNLDPGDRVLDVGCGPGVNFGLLHDAVTDEGRVSGIDYSPQMVERARDRVAEHGWDNVDVRRADACSVDLDPASFDAAVATLSLSVLPDQLAAVERIHDALVPGGPLGVLDLRLVPSGPARLCNPLLSLVFRWIANWNPDGDVLEALERTFETVEVASTRAAGVNYTAIARKAGGGGRAEQRGFAR